MVGPTRWGLSSNSAAELPLADTRLLTHMKTVSLQVEEEGKHHTPPSDVVSHMAIEEWA